MSPLCQSQQRCVKASIVSGWRLAEAQDQLGSLGVHSSESLEQERARSRAGPTELSHTEEEWRRKESMLGGQEPSRSPMLGAVGSWDVFDKVRGQVAPRPAVSGPRRHQRCLLTDRVSLMSEANLWKRISARRFCRSTRKSSGTLVSGTKSDVLFTQQALMFDPSACQAC